MGAFSTRVTLPPTCWPLNIKGVSNMTLQLHVHTTNDQKEGCSEGQR
jgi:hypothetical protein